MSALNPTMRVGDQIAETLQVRRPVPTSPTVSMDEGFIKLHVKKGSDRILGGVGILAGQVPFMHQRPDCVPPKRGVQGCGGGWAGAAGCGG